MVRNGVKNPKQIKISKIRPIVSRTDLKGVIKYCNPYFCEISGYTEKELLNSPHNIIRHPDMPKIIFKFMWNRIKKNEDILAIVKNRTKDGNYYWVTTSFESKYHPVTGEHEGYLALRHAAPKSAIKSIEPIYKKLIEIEDMYGISAAEAYFIDFLRRKNISYDDYVKDLTKYRGIVASLFSNMRKIFA